MPGLRVGNRIERVRAVRKRFGAVPAFCARLMFCTLAGAALALVSASAVAQDDAAKRPADMRKAMVSCVLTLDLRRHVEDVNLDMGTKQKPRPLVLVKTRGFLLSAVPTPGYDPEGCKKAEISRVEEELPPLYFNPGQQGVLKYPSKIEALLTVIPGFAYYGIPNQVVTEYRRTLP